MTRSTRRARNRRPNRGGQATDRDQQATIRTRRREQEDHRGAEKGPRQQADDQELASIKALYEQEKQLAGQKPAQIAEINNKIEALEAQHTLKMLQEQTKAAQETAKVWQQESQQMAGTLTSSLSQAIEGAVEHTKTKDAGKKLAQSLFNELINDLVKNALTKPLETALRPCSKGLPPDLAAAATGVAGGCERDDEHDYSRSAADQARCSSALSATCSAAFPARLAARPAAWRRGGGRLAAAGRRWLIFAGLLLLRCRLVACSLARQFRRQGRLPRAHSSRRDDRSLRPGRPAAPGARGRQRRRWRARRGKYRPCFADLQYLRE